MHSKVRQLFAISAIALISCGVAAITGNDIFAAVFAGMGAIATLAAVLAAK